MTDDPIEEFRENFPTWDRKALEELLKGLHSDPDALTGILQQESIEPAFDPLKVRNMIREATKQGHEPSGIVLGLLQAASFHHFVSRGFGEESGSDLKEHYFMGLHIFQDSSPSRLELIDESDSGDHHPDHSPGLAA